MKFKNLFWSIWWSSIITLKSRQKILSSCCLAGSVSCVKWHAWEKCKYLWFLTKLILEYDNIILFMNNIRVKKKKRIRYSALHIQLYWVTCVYWFITMLIWTPQNPISNIYWRVDVIVLEIILRSIQILSKWGIEISQLQEMMQKYHPTKYQLMKYLTDYMGYIPILKTRNNQCGNQIQDQGIQTLLSRNTILYRAVL